MKTIAIIGGWPAGMMTAASILENAKNENFQIILIEANKKLGRKLVISGGGRCNVTTAIFDKKILATKYTRGFDFFEKILGEFGPKKTKKWFENHDLPLKIEPDNRIFPTSDDGDDVLGVFENIFKNHEKFIKIFTETKVLEIKNQKNIDSESNSEWQKNFLIKTTKSDIEVDIVVIATGGNAYRKTGSTGDGYDFAKNLGHSITTLGPSLSSFLVAEDFVKNMSGLTFSDAKIIFWKNFEKNVSGSLLLTHFGISGPLTFMLSSHLAWEKIEKNTVKICPVATMNFDDWNQFLMEKFTTFPKRKIFAILWEILPKKFAENFIENFCKNIDEKMVGEIPKTEREHIAKILGNGIEITLLDRRPWDEFVTAGGVETAEIDGKTLVSRLVENLYFAGEILNIDGYTGGFSLQICWSTGHKVGKSVAEKIL